MNKDKVVKVLKIITVIILIVAAIVAISADYIIIKKSFNTKVSIDGSDFTVISNIFILIGSFLIGGVFFLKIASIAVFIWLIYGIVILIIKIYNKHIKKDMDNN